MRTAIIHGRLGAIVVLVAFALASPLVSSQRAALAIASAAAVGAIVGQALISIMRGRRGTAAPAVAVVPGGLARRRGADRWEYISPAELPPPLGVLIGRQQETEAVCSYLAGRSAERCRAVVISGVPGIGKSALAIRAAHLLTPHYPDGQLFYRLDDGSPPRPEQALKTFFEALKGPDEQIPPPDQQGQWFDQRTRALRVLVVLDNVGDLRPLAAALPTGPGCAAIITSRAPVGIDRPYLPVPIGPLSPAAGAELLGALVGPAKVAGEPVGAAALVAASAGYPVAIEIAGAVLARRPNWTLTLAVERMRDRPFTAPAGSPLPPFSRVFDLAFALLTERERTTLVLLGLLTHRWTAPWMVGALLCGYLAGAEPVDQEYAGRLLDRLAHARLAERRVDDESGLLHFRIPQYVHDYARARAATLTADERARADEEFRRERRERAERRPEKLLRATVFRHLSAGRLSSALYAAREALALSQELRSSPAAGPDPARLNHQEGLTLSALAEVYAELGWIESGISCAELALSTDRVSPQSRPRAHRALGVMRRNQRQWDLAHRNLEAAALAGQEIDDPPERLRILRERAVTQALAGRLQEAEVSIDEAWALCGRNGASGGRARPSVLLARARVLAAHGRRPEADRVLAEADGLSCDPALGQGLWTPWIRYHRASIALDACHYERSRELAQFALEGFTGLRHRYGTAHCRLLLGRAFLAESLLAKATSMLEEAHSTLVRCGDRWAEANAAVELAAAYRVGRRGLAAVNLLERAEQGFTKLGDAHGQRRAAQLLWNVESELPRPSRPATTVPSGTSSRLRRSWGAVSRLTGTASQGDG